MKIYLVGGAVRDQLIGRKVRERDWLVVNASVDEMLKLGFTRKDDNFPVFNHPQTGEEYALARREIKQGVGYKGFIIDASKDITLEEDLLRRDLTINAMAMDEQGNLIDPYGGHEDLKTRILRHVTDAFVEDPFRILRVARFAAQLGRYDFHVAHETFRLMKSMVKTEELQAISQERFQSEMNKALSSETPQAFFKLLGKCGALNILLPDSQGFINGEQMQHGKDSDCLQKLIAVTKLTENTDLRFVAVFGYVLLKDDYDVTAFLRLNKRRADLLGILAASTNDLLKANCAADLYQAMQQAGALKTTTIWSDVLLLLKVFYPPQQQRLINLQNLASQMSALSSRSLIENGLEGAALGEALKRQRLELVETMIRQL